MPPENVSIHEILLDGVRCPLSGRDGAVTFSDLARFQTKILFGDPSKDDNDLLSVWQMSDGSGGSGVLDLKEGTDQGRFSMGTAYWRFPGQLTKPPYVSNNAAGGLEGSGNKIVLGEMWSADQNDYIIIYEAGGGVRRGLINGTVVSHMLNSSFPDAVANSYPFGTTAVGPGVAFQGAADKEWFFIPLGNAGYAWLTDTNDDTTVNGSSIYNFTSFAVWDSKLIGVTTGGRLYYTRDPDENDDGTGVVTWTPYDVTYSLSRSYRIRKMISYYDRGDRPALFILTDRDMWQFDPDGPELFRIDFGWPSHRYHAQAACVWNGQLLVALGMAVFRYTGGTWMPIGLDRDNGLPAEYKGHIVELVAGQNSVYALVQSDVDDAVYGSKSSIHEWSGSGWQCIWNDDTDVPSDDAYRATLATTALTVTGLIVTQSGTGSGQQSIQTLVFSTAGSDDHIYTMPLSAEWANPRSGVLVGQLFGDGDYYYLETGEFDADMEQYTKIGNAIQFTIEEPNTDGVTDDERDTFRVLHRVDRGDWVEICSVTANAGRYAYPLGDLIDTTTAQYEGIPFERIQFRFEIIRAATTNIDKPMILTNFVFSFLKTVSSNDAFTVAIDCSNGAMGPSGYLTPTEFAAFIDGLTNTKRFVNFKVNNLDDVDTEGYRVFVSQNKGTRYAGDAEGNIRQLSIVQIPSGL